MNDDMMKARMRVGAMAIGLVLAAGATLAGAQDPATEGAARRRYESGLTFLAEKKYSEALKDFQAVVDSYQQSRVVDAALLRIAEYQLDVAGDTAAAQVAVDLLQKKYGNSESGPMGLVLAGRIILAKSRVTADVESAIASYDRVPRLFPGADAVPASMYYAGEALRLTHRDTEAIGRFRQVSTDYPESEWAPRALLSEARCLVLTGKAPRAMELLQRVRQRFPKTPEAGTAIEWNTILYRLYLRAPAQPAFQFAAQRTIVGPGGRLKNVQSMAIGPGGRLYASNKDAVLVFDLAGKPVATMAASDARAIAFDRSGNPTFVCREGIVGPDGALHALTVPKQDGTPRTLGDITSGVITSMGDLLVVDSNAKDIARFANAGRFAAPFASVFPFKLAIDATDRVVSLDESGNGLSLLEHDGRARATVPARGQGYEFDRPIDLAIDALGHVYVLDRNRATVFVFAQGPQPRLLSAFSIPAKSPGAFRKAVCFALDPAGRLYVYDDDVEKIQVYQ
jgi:TolA-binding protein